MERFLCLVLFRSKVVSLGVCAGSGRAVSGWALVPVTVQWPVQFLHRVGLN